MHFLAWYALGGGLGVLALTLLLHYTHLHGQGHPRAHFQLVRWLHAHLLLATLAAALSGILAGFFVVAGYTVIQGRYGPLQPPVPALHPHGSKGTRGHHGLGLIPPKGKKKRPHLFGAYGLPASVDLSSLAPPVGDQKGTQSCGSWATGYMLRYYYARRAGQNPGVFSPMFLYSQVAHGYNQPTAITDNLALMRQQGITPLAHYSQGLWDYTTFPTLYERQQASPWRINGFVRLYAGAGQGYGAQLAIEASLAQGNPVVLGIPVFGDWFALGPSNYFLRGGEGYVLGYHALTILKYDSEGAWGQNTYGTAWGLGGWVELSWAYINTLSVEADTAIVPLPPPAPTPTPQPTPNPLAGRLFVLLHDQRVRPLPAAWPVGLRVLHQGIILRATGQQKGKWLRLFVPGGRSWVLRSNLRRLS